MRKFITGLTTICFLFLISGIVHAALVADYPFNGNANDESGTGNHGTVSGATLAPDRWGLAGSAYSFDGINDTIGILDSASLNISGDLSISAWINTSFDNISAEYIFSNMQEVSPHDGYAFSVTWSTHALRFMSGDISLFGTTPVNTGTWTHVVATLSGATATIYINGVVEATGAVGVPVYTTTTVNEAIGSSRNGGAYFWNGLIDDVKIYNHALSTPEVSALYNATSYGTAIAQEVYWTESGSGLGDGRIQKGSEAIETLATGLTDVSGTVLDFTNSKIYWTDDWNNVIKRSNFDGTGVETLFDGTDGVEWPRSIALDVAAGKVYWSQSDPAYPPSAPPWESLIKVGNMDGSGSPVDLISGFFIRDITLDLTSATQKIYWSAEDPAPPGGIDPWVIMEANLDGSSPGILYRGGFPMQVVLDQTNGTIYWEDGGGCCPPGYDTWKRANLDGTSTPPFFALSGTENYGITGIDGAGGKIYWGDSGVSGVDDDGQILRSNLDGTGVETLYSGLNYPGGHSYNLYNSKIYFFDSDPATPNLIDLHRANMDGTSGIQDVVTGLTEPFIPAIDTINNKIYWTDATDNLIQRANLDGTGTEILFDATTDGVDFPRSIALDVLRGKVYWSQNDGLGGGAIKEGNMDGTGLPIDLITGLSFPRDVEIDLTNNKIYWSDNDTAAPAGSQGVIKVANLNGSGVGDLYSGLPFPRGVALDVLNNQIYWSDDDTTGTDTEFKRANLNGSTVLPVSPLLTLPGDFIGPIDIDLVNDKLYWANEGAVATAGDGSIQRSNLDGTGLETLFTGLDEPWGVALLIPGTTQYSAPLPGEETVDLTAPAGEVVSDVSTAPATGTPPPGIDFSMGMISYQVTSPPGGCVTTTLAFSSSLPRGLILYKVDDAGSYTEIPVGPGDDTWTKISGNAVEVTLCDGGVFDLNPAPGIIRDPIGIGAESSTAITLSDFIAYLNGEQIILSWSTSSETDNEGFIVLRSEFPSGPYAPITLSMIPAMGGPGMKAVYTYTDSAVEEGKTYYYRLKDVDAHGVAEVHSIVPVTVDVARASGPPQETAASASQQSDIVSDKGTVENVAIQFDENPVRMSVVMNVRETKSPVAGTTTTMMSVEDVAPANKSYTGVSSRDAGKIPENTDVQKRPLTEITLDGRNHKVETQHASSSPSTFSVSIEDDKGNIIMVSRVEDPSKTSIANSDFEVTEESDRIVLFWQGKGNVKGFILHRAEKGKDDYTPISNLIPYFGQGDKDIYLYRFTDNSVKSGVKYDYQLERVSSELKIGKVN